MARLKTYTIIGFKKHPKDLSPEEMRAPISVKKFTTSMEELIDMAKRWTFKDIAKEFEISVPTVKKLLTEHGILKDNHGGVKLVMPLAS